MYVARVRLSNIRGFTGKRAVDLALPARGSWTVLAGRNGSGKTTLLQAVALTLGGPSVSRTLVADFGGWLTTRARLGWAEASVVRDESDALTGRGRAPKGELVLGLNWSRPVQGGGERLESLRPSMEPFKAPSAARGRGTRADGSAPDTGRSGG
ncbi:AAA family ATPase [Streptomyces sp. H27-D2]|uniref:AAA family ATPase n=1 Tax=Streptomyces sp. H27-D2 TaxID=3046304 RepID=UPI002DB9DD4A|nr:AAA family ATPase [Streptomyces sp. H27-D2]MEC4017801.1 AAA family ATPase [Streptomyces sp. H27-D2]